jgi:hypothetical protein
VAWGYAFGERRNFCDVHSCPGCEWLQGPSETTSLRFAGS